MKRSLQTNGSSLFRFLSGSDGNFIFLSKRIGHYCNVTALGILVIFHSKCCERVFGLETKNKTQHRASLSTDMLRSLVTHKVMMSAKQQVCHTQTFSDTLLRKAKSATYEAKHSRSESAVWPVGFLSVPNNSLCG